MFEILYNYCMLFKGVILNFSDITKEKKKSIDCNVIKGKIIIKLNILR